MSDLDIDQLAELVLSMNGPYDPDRMVAAARLVRELVRRLNHATLRPPAVAPEQLDNLVGALAGVRLPLLMSQLANVTANVAQLPTLIHDRGQDAAAVALTAAGALSVAADHAGRWALAVADAQNRTAALCLEEEVVRDGELGA